MVKKSSKEKVVRTKEPVFDMQETIAEETMPEIQEYEPVAMMKKAQEETVNREPVNCLRKERVIVRYISRPSTMVQNPKHVLYGGMAETATRSFVVPRLNSTGQYKNVLTDSEKECLERVMGLEYGALSVYKKENNFWDDSNPNGIGRVTLHKQDNFLDLSIPEDYIKYKILLANKDQICPSKEDLENRPKATYQFVIISESGESHSSLNRMDMTMECYMEYGSVRDDVDTLRLLIETFEGRAISANVKKDYLQNKINEYIQRDPRKFLKIIKDELLPTKVLIKKAVDAGIIGKKNDAYYLRQDGTPLCEMGEESTLNNAARYISSIKRQELKYSLEAKVKE